MTIKQSGFTLIELLISVAIVGIIATIAYPSYQDNIQQSKRKEAQAALVSFANAMEMWKMQNGNSYCASLTGACTAPTVFSTVVPVNVLSTDSSVIYNLTISAVAATTYTLSAAPVATDSTCGTLTLDNIGNKTPTAAGCW